MNKLLEIFCAASLRLNTQSTYASLQRTYSSIAQRIGANPYSPVQESQLSMICILYSLTHKVTSLPPFIAAVAKLHESNGWPPLPRGDKFSNVIRGINNYFAHTSASLPRTAITIDDLFAFRSHLTLSKFEDARDWCSYLFAFFGLLRVGEYTGGSLRRRDVTPAEDRIRLSIAFSKTALRPVLIDLAKRNDELDPITALAQYLSFFPSSSISDKNAIMTPLFLTAPSSASKPLDDRVFTHRLRNLIRASLPSVDPSRYAGHSFRRGGATALLMAGVEEAVIKRHGRWKSEAVRCYYDGQNSDAVRLLATRTLASTPRSVFRSSSSNSAPFSDEVESQLDM